MCAFERLRKLTVWLLLCGGCGLGGAQENMVLTVAAYPAFDSVVKAALPRWQALHPNVTVKVVSRNFDDHHTAMTTAISTSAQLPDVMALEIGYVGRFARGGGLENLSAQPYAIGRFRDQWVRYAVDQATRADGTVVAAPADIGPGTLLYRADILAQAGVNPEDLTRSWESFVQAGVRIRAQTGARLVAHARDIKDIVIRTGVAPGEGLYFDRQSRVLVNSPRFVRAFELARSVRQHQLDAKVPAWSNEWSEGLRRGRIATLPTGAWMAGHLNNWLAPSTRGQWRASALPEGSHAAYGGTFVAIPRGVDPRRKALAWDLIRLLTLDTQQQISAFKAQDAFPALLSTHNDAFFDEALPFLGGQPARRLWRESTQRISAVAVHKQDAFADEVINTELDKVLTRNKPIAQALADAQRLLQRRAHR